MMNPQRRRVVVTGRGAICDVGQTVSESWSALVEGRSGVGPIVSFAQGPDWNVKIAGEVRDWDPSSVIDSREAKRMDRFCLLGMWAAEEAAAECGIDFAGGDPTRRGIVIGSGVGGIQTIEIAHERLLDGGPRKLSPFTVPKLMVNAASGNVSIRHNLRGANSAVATACASGGHAIGAAMQVIQRGDADVMFAGGSEAAVSPLCLGSFAAMKALSTRNDDPTRASRPFDRGRDGFVLAEGAGILVLEDLDHAKARGAQIFAEVVGFGSSCDAQHIAAPDPEGTGAKAAMEIALADAGLNATDVDYINAHGTSTPLGDAAEVLAVKGLFGNHAHKLAISSTKSMTGHALGAAGGIESVVSIGAVLHDVIPPTINLDDPDDDFDLDFVPHTARETPVRYAVNNTFGFGGHNVSLIFAKFTG